MHARRIRAVVSFVVLVAGARPAFAEWDCYAPQPGHPTSAEKTAFVNEIKVYAQEAEATWGTPAAALVAMASNESGFGFTRIGLYARNLFGWKYYGATSAAGRAPYTLSCQPSWDPNNQYVTFSDRRDSVLFVAMKLATLPAYKDDTERYVSDIRAGVAVITAIDRWVQGIQSSGYNPYASYVTKTRSFLNNYMAPSSTYSSTDNLYQYSPVTGPVENVWISIDAPASDATVSGSVPIRSQVGGGAVTQVKFYSRQDGATSDYLISTDTAAPYEISWATDPWVPDGLYQLKAEAWNGTLLKATGTLRVTVKNGVPALTITSPASGATVSGDVLFNASLGGGSADRVQFSSRAAGSTGSWYLINTDTAAPYGCTWVTAPYVNDGEVDLKAEAYLGSIRVASSTVTVTVKNAQAQRYWVDFTSPRNGDQVSGDVSLVTPAGGDPLNTVSSVRFYSRAAGSTGSWYLITTDALAPYSASWATAPWVADGDYELKAEAYDGNTLVATKTIAVKVQNADTVAPAVAITSPPPGAVVSGNVSFCASASDISGIARIELLSDSGNYLIATATAAPYCITWATDPWVGNGFQTLVARAFDAAGNSAQASATVTVDNPTGGITLNNGVDNTALTFTTGGAAQWYGDNLYWYAGGDSARSGIIGDGQTSWLQLTASGPRTLRFVWRVSSQLYADYLELWIDGVKKNSISGDTAWAAQSWWLPSGSHTIKLQYRKDASGKAGSDAGWIDALTVQ